MTVQSCCFLFSLSPCQCKHFLIIFSTPDEVLLTGVLQFGNTGLHIMLFLFMHLLTNYCLSKYVDGGEEVSPSSLRIAELSRMEGTFGGL